MITREDVLKRVYEVQKREFAARVEDLNALRKTFGEQIVDIIASERAEKTKEQWRAVAQAIGRNDIEGLEQTLWQQVAAAGFEFTTTKTSEGTQFRVTKCPLAEMAREINAADWGFVCYCADDPHIAAGFNPRLGFRRTKTLMEGHDCCDHFYFMQSEHSLE